MRYIALPMLLCIIVLSGCADPYRNLYEGMQKREGIANPVAKPAQDNVPYDQYKAERDRLQDKASEKPHGSDPAN